MKKVLGILVLTFISGAFAHEGHNHDDPTISPTKGGVIKVYGEVRKCYMEVKKISKKNEVNIYLYGADSKKIRPAKDFTIKASAQLPRFKTAESLVVTDQGDFYQVSYDKKSSHRYSLIINLEKDITGECSQDQLDFTIE
jgi:hypothetical protein